MKSFAEKVDKDIKNGVFKDHVDKLKKKKDINDKAKVDKRFWRRRHRVKF